MFRARTLYRVYNCINVKTLHTRTNKWIKQIELDRELSLKDYRLTTMFKKIAYLDIDNEYKNNGVKKRNTTIKFVPQDNNEWTNKNEWIYMFTIDDKIVKIGGTRTGLKQRAASYLCGHYTLERGKSGKCSVTNAYIYNTFDFYLRNDYNIDMYGYMIPKCQIPLYIIDEIVNVDAQVFHAYEAKFLEEYKKTSGKYPSLSDNADPKYK